MGITRLSAGAHTEGLVCGGGGNNVTGGGGGGVGQTISCVRPGKIKNGRKNGTCQECATSLIGCHLYANKVQDLLHHYDDPTDAIRDIASHAHLSDMNCVCDTDTVQCNTNQTDLAAMGFLTNMLYASYVSSWAGTTTTAGNPGRVVNCAGCALDGGGSIPGVSFPVHNIHHPPCPDTYRPPG